ncbi:TIGR03084 family metal-binding protein [Streptosporangium sp. NPDC051023]|uniref:TIGR03084 family metal-binding protein n=1 Tax=Streptosporangium sp. NPDC051023 TaxID=3155410 RepID=UPI00344FAEC8
MTQLQDVISDVTAEAEELDRLVAGLGADRWALPTPAPGWTIKHQIAHLVFVFRLAGLAASDPETFNARVAEAGKDFNGAVNAALAEHLGDPPETLFAHWQASREASLTALAAVPEEQTVPWLVRPLPPVVLACAGYMELFGHGQDIADTLGVWREPTDRIRHLVGFAVLTKEFGYLARGLTPPREEFRFELTSPSGELWVFGPQDAEQRVTGPAHDFCLLVVRRRHRDDLALTASGAEADRWLDIAQAYRGPAGEGRSPGQFATTRR